MPAGRCWPFRRVLTPLRRPCGRLGGVWCPLVGRSGVLTLGSRRFGACRTGFLSMWRSRWLACWQMKDGMWCSVSSRFRRPPAFSLARLTRSKCSECSAPYLEWGILGDLLDEVEPSERLDVLDLQDQLGRGAQAWYCPACGAWGAFGDEGSWSL